MPYIPQTTDLTSQYLSFPRSENDFRPAPSLTFTPGLIVQLAPVSAQIYPDWTTVQLPGTGASQSSLVGVVSDTWPGFNGSIGTPSYASPASSTVQRGTTGVLCVTAGIHPAVWIDQSGTGAVTITDGIPIVPSRATAGYGQGVAVATAPGAMGTIGVAKLPASGIGSSLTAAALAQASQTVTIAGTPAAGDIITVKIQAPYNTTAPGVVQTISYVTPALTTAQATSVTTAALAVLTYLNSIPSFSQYFLATQSAGVITITVVANTVPFLVTFGSGTTLQGAFYISISGMVANSLTISTSVNAGAGSTSTAGGSTFASGTGYQGTIPVWVH